MPRGTRCVCAGSSELARAADVLAGACVCRSGGRCRLNCSYRGLFLKSPMLTCILPCIPTFECKRVGTHSFYSHVFSHVLFHQTHTPCSATHKHSTRWKTHPELCPDSSRRPLGSWWRAVGATARGSGVCTCVLESRVHVAALCVRGVCVWVYALM